jgi:hypothetical protein
MTTKATPRIGFYVLAAVLLAVQAPRTSLAEEAANQGGTVTSAPGSDSADHANGAGDNGSAKTDTAKPDSVKPNATSPAGGHEAGGKPDGVHTNGAVNDSSHFGSARDAGPVDAHIAPPARHNGNRFSARDPKSRFRIGSNPRPRSAPGHTVSGPVTRNSIGLAVPAQPNKLDRDSKPPAPVVAPAANAPSVSAVKTEPTVEHTIVSHPNVSAPVAINGSAIGGNANIKRGSGPASIGGQTKTAAGINGSTIPHRIR